MSATRRTLFSLARARPTQSLARTVPRLTTVFVRRFASDFDYNAPGNQVDANPDGIRNLQDGLSDEPVALEDARGSVDWSKSFDGLSQEPFEQRIQDILMEPVNPDDIEMKSDGIAYLPEIKYRRILNRAFGPGGWGLAPRGETIVTERLVTREYALVCHGRLIAIARGEQQYFTPDGIPTATEGCKSNALMRCCKDLGIASELWDPRFIKNFKKNYCVAEFVEHQGTKMKKKLWRLKGESWEFPYKLASSFGDNDGGSSSFVRGNSTFRSNSSFNKN